MKKSIYIATLMAAFGLLAFCEEPAVQPANPIVPAVQADTANAISPNRGVELPSQPQNTVTKTCGIPANAGSAGGFSARAKGAQPKTQQTPASCRKQCGSDTLCYICCLHPDPSHCF